MDGNQTPPLHRDAPCPGEVDQRFTAARNMAMAAGRVLLDRFRGGFTTQVKADASRVTDVDIEVETEVRRQIAELFPADSVLGEELGCDDRGGDWCCALAPLDGTHNFIAGIPVFSVAIAVLYRGEPAIAVVHDPCRGETYAAAHGRGTQLNGVPIRVADAPLDRFSMITVQHRFLRGPRVALLESLPTRKFRCLGSLCLEMAYVAAGAVSASIAGSARLWEVAAGAALIEGAGGVVYGSAARRFFPLAGALPDHAEQRFRILGGAPAVVEELAAHLGRLPL